MTVREDLDHGRITHQPPPHPAGWYRARRAWIGGIPYGVGIRRAWGHAQAASARQHGHPQRLCDDHGARHARHQGRRRSREGRRDRGRRPEAQRTRCNGDQWRRHDRAARTGRNPLAYVNTLLRSMSGEKPELGYFRTTAALGQKYEPTDMYQGTRLAAGEGINRGITFVHDWCHNIRSPAYLEQDLRALRESGLR